MVLLYKANITIIPKLNVKFFGCSSHPKEDVGNCAFPRVGLWRFQVKSYFLSANGLPRVQCIESPYDAAIVECMNIPINQNIKSHTFKLEMEYVGDVQAQEISLNIKQIVSPSLSMLGIRNITLENCICLHIDFLRTPFDMLFCQWNVIPSNPRVEKWNRNFSIASNASEFRDCPQESLPAYQRVEFQVYCRINVDVSPWSNKYSRDCITPDDLPRRPPDILPNGFSHDRNKNRLYVFWTHLDELDWNGPDFTYSVGNDLG